MNEGSGDSLGGDNSLEVRDLQEGREREIKEYISLNCFLSISISSWER